MGALHFLDDAFILQDAVSENVAHELELYEQGGELYLRIWIGGSGADMPVVCKLTNEQAAQLADGGSKLR